MAEEEALNLPSSRQVVQELGGCCVCDLLQELRNAHPAMCMLSVSHTPSVNKLLTTASNPGNSRLQLDQGGTVVSLIPYLGTRKSHTAPTHHSTAVMRILAAVSFRDGSWEHLLEA